MVRSFVAIEFPDSVRNEIARLLERLPRLPGITYVHPNRMHLTLRFLGDIDDGQSVRLRQTLRDAATSLRPFEVRVQGVGAFPSLRRPSVLWVGLVASDASLVQAQELSERAAQAIGLPAETKAFHPHVTLARVRDSRFALEASDALHAERDFDAGAFVVSGMTLFHSRLTPHGPVYTPIEEFAFT